MTSTSQPPTPHQAPAAPPAAPVPNTPTGPVPSAATASGRARPGELRAWIAKILATSPSGAQFSVTELAHTLGHSGGAVGNACETLVARGEAERVGSKPRTYRATGLTAGAAQHTVTMAPSPG
ncbi:hypothetical protein AB4212_57415, partial [Streptomyces sp. 2MCAF27]